MVLGMWDAKSYKKAMVGPSRLVGNVGCPIIAFGQPQAGLTLLTCSTRRPACGCPKAMIAAHPTLPTSLDGPTMAFL